MNSGSRACRLVPILLLLCNFGCSSLGNLRVAVVGIPAIPVSRVPREYLGRPKSEMVELSPIRLRQNKPDAYLLGAGDILAVYIEAVLGVIDENPPIHIPEAGDQPPAIGYPIPIQEDGTLPLPLIQPLKVSGMTLDQASNAITRAYTVDREIVPKGKNRILVTLMRRRESRVLVIREETSGGGGQGQSLGGIGAGASKRGSGYTLDLPAYENDVLHALNLTGGLPGDDAKDQVVIYRGMFDSAEKRDQLVADLARGRNPCSGPTPLPGDPNIVRIPLRYYPDALPTFTQDDIILNTGDILVIETRETEKYYTGGALRGGERLLPRDYDLDILQAVAVSNGPLGGTGSGINQIGGSGGGGGNFGGGGGGGGGYGAIPPSQAIVLRKLPDGSQVVMRVDLSRALTDLSQRVLVQPEDVILVQYTLPEEIANALLRLISFNFLFSGFSGKGI